MSLSKCNMAICRIYLFFYLSIDLYAHTHTHTLLVLHAKRIQSNELEQKGAKGPCLKQFSLKRSLVCNEPSWQKYLSA